MIKGESTGYRNEKNEKTISRKNIWKRTEIRNYSKTRNGNKIAYQLPSLALPPLGK